MYYIEPLRDQALVHRAGRTKGRAPAKERGLIQKRRKRGIIGWFQPMSRHYGDIGYAECLVSRHWTGRVPDVAILSR